MYMYIKVQCTCMFVQAVWREWKNVQKIWNLQNRSLFSENGKHGLTLWRLHLKNCWTLMSVLYDDVQMEQ